METDVSEPAGEKFQRLVEIMARLRGPGGCPWDREQTFDTIKPYLLEETYEVLDSIDARDWNGLADELGDLLLQSVFFAQMAAEERRFSIADSLDAIIGKLIRRHPHVFAAGDARTPSDVVRRWEEIKDEERRDQGKPAAALLDKVPRSLPALVEAQKISTKAADTGFDWESRDQVLDKLREELGELSGASGAAHVEQEIGDILFVVVNLARFHDVDPEQALRKCNARFRRRFAHVESRLAEQGKLPNESTIDEMERFWQEAKRLEDRVPS